MQSWKMTDLNQNKKGFALELIALVVIGFISVLFFAGWMYGINLVNTQLLNIPSEDNATNISYAASQTFSYMNEGLSALKLISFMIIFGFVLGTLIFAYFSRKHPVLFIVYFLIWILAIIFSIYVSNAYEEVLNNNVLGTTLATFGISNWIMLKLPWWIAVVGAVGIIIMLAGIIKDRELGG